MSLAHTITPPYVLLPEAVEVLALFLWPQGLLLRCVRVFKPAGCETPSGEIDAPCLKIVMQKWQQAPELLG